LKDYFDKRAKDMAAAKASDLSATTSTPIEVLPIK
jgi:hypothetical protein